MLTHDDYTVGWICALPLEMTAAKAMLDETNPGLSQRPTDPNGYTLGRIGGHKVVIACLPFGVYGTTSSSSVAAHMLSTFPRIQFALMVGIGGGVPTKEVDIRLGDVVVSKPTGSSGGVVQYDYGKMMAGGRFQQTGTLNQPPTILLTSMSQLQSDDGTKNYRSLSTIVSGTLDRDNNLRYRFPCPGQENDQLFQSEYEHMDGRDECSRCDTKKLVSREPRASDHPYVHYGLIASGNQVMKDGRTRDRLARELGVVCFEMEAAGLMNHMPCLVIRGICDYSDSHKQKKWQGYAALTAAAYGKLLLSVVPAATPRAKANQKAELTDEEQVCLRDLFLTDPAEDKNALKRRKGDRAPGTGKWILEMEELEKWLGLKKITTSGPDPNILWFYGNPGTGKTTIAITMVEELAEKPKFRQGDGILSYFFCDSNIEDRRSASGVLRGMLYQFIKQRPELMRFLHPKYQERRSSLFSSFDALWSVMVDIGRDSESGNKYCIIDALDECDLESQHMLLAQISQDFENHNSGQSPSYLHIMITSRPYPEIGRYLNGFNHKDLASYEKIKRDLEVFIGNKVKDLSQRNRYSEKIAGQVQQIIRDKAEGTFLWVGIASAELASTRSRDAVKKLQNLTRGLHSLYGQLLDVALKQDEEDHKTIIQMLSFVATARRPLTTAELAEACEQYKEEDEETRLRFTQEDIEMCRLMIIIQDGIVRLLHKSVKDFLLGEGGRNLIDELKAHATLANRCIDEVFRYARKAEHMRKDEQKNLFLNYSAVYWPEHAALAQSEFTVLEDHESFFELKSDEREQWLALYKGYKIFANIPKRFSIFHVAARWGIKCLIPFALTNLKAPTGSDGGGSTDGKIPFIDTDFKAENGVTPLQEAVKQGHLFILSMLLDEAESGILIREYVVAAIVANEDNGLDIISFLLGRDGVRIHITARVVIAAAKNRKFGEEAMRALLAGEHDENYVQPRAQRYVCKLFGLDIVKLIPHLKVTADTIMAAAANRQSWKEVIIFLLGKSDSKRDLSHEVMMRAIDDWKVGKKAMLLLLKESKEHIHLSRYIVQAAVRKWEDGEEAISLLLSRGTEDMGISADAVTAICEMFDSDIVKLLFQSRRDNMQITPKAIRAVCNRFDNEIVQIVLEYENEEQAHKQTALLSAAENGNIGLWELLVGKYQLDINYVDDSGRTALSYAAESGNEAIVARLFSNSQLEISSKDKDGWTALLFAVWNGKHDIVQRIIAMEDLDINSNDDDGRTALIFAAWNGDIAVIQQLQTIKLLDVNCQDTDGRSALFYASYFGHDAAVRQLLKSNNIEINSQDYDGRTALLYASKLGHGAVVRELMKRENIDTDRADCWGDTAMGYALDSRNRSIICALLRKEIVHISVKEMDSIIDDYEEGSRRRRALLDKGGSDSDSPSSRDHISQSIDHQE